jgi:hypothetical protein
VSGVRTDLFADGSVPLGGSVVFVTSAPFLIERNINGESDMLPSDASSCMPLE